MFNKLYEKIKKTIKENYKFLLLITIIYLVFNIRFPYYINAPGGLIDISKKVKVENSYKVSGSLNLAYVSEIKATIPTLLYSLINKDFKIIQEEAVIYDNETEKEASFRDKMLLEESNSDAILLALRKANKEAKQINNKVYITYIDEESDTDLKIGDQIIKINNVVVNTKRDILEEIKKYNLNDKLNIKVINEKEEKIRTATLKKFADKTAIGIVLSEKYDIDTNEKIKLNFKKNETGPSGGLMMSLAIYNYLVEEDITKSLKIVGTGTIDLEGNVGSIGGIEYKLKGAVKKHADIFITPIGDNYDEAFKLIKENNYKIKLIGVSTFDEAIEELKKL